MKSSSVGADAEATGDLQRGLFTAQDGGGHSPQAPSVRRAVVKSRIGQRHARLWQSNFDVMGINAETRDKMKGRAALRHDFMFSGETK